MSDICGKKWRALKPCLCLCAHGEVLIASLTVVTLCPTDVTEFVI